MNAWAWFIVAEVMACLAYRLLVVGRLEQTSALFIGLPALLAFFLAQTATPKSRSGRILKGTILFLLLSGPILGEGFICILMASPIFLLVAAFVGWLADWSEKRRFVLAWPVFLIALEGTTGFLSFDRQNTVAGERIVTLTPEQLQHKLNSMPTLHHDALPFYLKLGFPRPMRVYGEGLTPGSRRGIHFAGGEGKPGDLVFEVVSASAEHVKFGFVSDSSHIAHWLQWQDTELRWTPTTGGQLKIHWTIRYRRLLDPAVYFGPWERYAVGLAGDYCLAQLLQ